MRSSDSVVRLPRPAKGIAIVRDVRPYGFDEEQPSKAGPQEGEKRAAAAVAAPSIDARLAAAREEGRQEGMREGHARGREEGLETARNAASLLDKALRRIGDERQSLLAKAERDIVDLALAIASRVLRREVDVDRDLVTRVVTDALRRASPLEEVVVRVHPSDYAHIKSVPGLEARLGEIRHLVLVEDRRVSVGGCLVETGSGAIDARVETQLEEITRALTRAAGGQAIGPDKG